MKYDGHEATDLRKLVQKLEIGSILTYHVIHAGTSNDVYDVSTTHGRFIVRRLRKYSHLEEGLAMRIRSRTQILNFLQEAGELFPFTVPSYVSDSNGSYVVFIGNKCFEAYSYIDGDTLKSTSLAQTEERGRTLAMLHQVFAHAPIVPSIPMPITPSEVRRRLSLIPKSILHHTDSAFRLAIETAYPYYSQLTSHLPEKDVDLNIGRHMILHGDLHNGNVLYLFGHLHGIVDFDNIMFGPRLLDVARAIGSRHEWHALIKGYDSISSLDSSEIKLLLVAKAMFAVAAFANLVRRPSSPNHFSTDLVTHRIQSDFWILRQLEAENL